MDDLTNQFMSITDATKSKAEQYLGITDYNVEQAIALYFDQGGVDLVQSATPVPAPRGPVSPVQTSGTNSRNAIPVGDDDDDAVSPMAEDDNVDLDWDDGTPPRRTPAARPPPSTRPPPNDPVEDDEAMARRLQNEMYAMGEDGTGTGTSTPGSFEYDADGVRAPMARTTETLVGPEDDYVRNIIQGRRPGAHRGPGRIGVFNQRPTGSIWDEESSTRDEDLAAATGGASRTSKKATQLATMFRPPFEIMVNLTIDEAKDYARERDKWVLVNIQDPSVFDSQVLNRDLWKDPQIVDIIKGNFVFLQFNRSEPEGLEYIRLYMAAQYSQDFPHIAILDPRTGEQLKVWQRVPDKAEFIMQLHEFLDRYSLSTEARNPVQATTKPKKDVAHMTEDEMLEMALKASMGDHAMEDDPDIMTLTNSEAKQQKETDTNNGEEDLINFDSPAKPEETDSSKPASAFSHIRSDVHHPEPAASPGVTRLQLRMPNGTRLIRRFNESDTVRTIFEFVKADWLPEQAQKEGNVELAEKEFELRAMQTNLIDKVDETIEQAGLKMSTLMLDFIEE